MAVRKYGATTSKTYQIWSPGAPSSASGPTATLSILAPKEELPRMPMPSQPPCQERPSLSPHTATHENSPTGASESAATVETTYESAREPLVTKLFSPLSRHPSVSEVSLVWGSQNSAPVPGSDRASVVRCSPAAMG